MFTIFSDFQRLDAFDPRWLVVSGGFDTYFRDPITTFQVATSGFHEIGRRIHAYLADSHIPAECQKRRE